MRPGKAGLAMEGVNEAVTELPSVEPFRAIRAFLGHNPEGHNGAFSDFLDLFRGRLQMAVSSSRGIRSSTPTLDAFLPVIGWKFIVIGQKQLDVG